MKTECKNILVVDDDPLLATSFQRYLADKGHKVFVAKDGRVAIQILAREVVEVVLLDIFMPDQDGIETLREIKRTFPEVRVAVMSGGGVRGRYDFLQAAQKFGADSVAQKPITPSQLLAIVEGGALPSPAND